MFLLSIHSLQIQWKLSIDHDSGWNLNNLIFILFECSEKCKFSGLVLIENVNLPPTNSALGRVIACHPGKYGKIRIATLQTAESFVLSRNGICSTRNINFKGRVNMKDHEKYYIS